MTCNLRKRDRDLCESHVIPEFLYRPLYDTKHRAVKLLVDKSRRFVQKGMRDLLLCKECEAHISKHIENPFAKQWWEILPSSCVNPLVSLSGLDYTVTKMMILTNLWRAHCSKKDEWKNVKLGRYSDEISHMIDNINPGDEDKFPIWGELIVDEENRVRSDIVTPFTQSRPDGHYVYYSAHGGVDWFVFLSPGIPQTRRIPQEACLKRNGKMTLMRKYLWECSSVKSFRASRRI